MIRSEPSGTPDWSKSGTIEGLVRAAPSSEYSCMKYDPTSLSLEEEAKAEGERFGEEVEERRRKGARSRLGKKQRKRLEGEPDPKAQRNFTDPESRILKTGFGYEQGYNCQAGVDSAHQVVVAQDVVAEQNDNEELLPLP